MKFSCQSFWLGSIHVSPVSLDMGQSALGLQALMGKEETSLQKAVFILLEVCEPLKQLPSGWCESHLEWRSVSDPLQYRPLRMWC